MKKSNFIAVSLFVVAFFAGAGQAMAQRDSTKLRQEVEVTKAYQPTISEAVKINDIPKIKPEQTEAPTFDYSIYSKPVFSTFDVKPVTAAKIVGEPKPEMENGILKLGVGNYLTPYGEFFFNSKPDKTTNFGMHFKHLSSSGKIKLLNDDKVDAPQSENSAEIFGKKFFRNSSLSGSLAYDRNAFNYYGYSGSQLSDEQKIEMIPWYQAKQYFSKGTASVNLKSETRSEYDVDYDLSLRYHYLKSKTGQTESEIHFSGNLAKKIGNTYGNLFVSLTNTTDDSIQNRISGLFGYRQQSIMKINPSAKWVADLASFELGLNTAMVSDADFVASFHVWPKIKAEWSPVEQYLTLFAGMDGYLKSNTYSAVANENPYVDPYHDAANTNYKSIFYGGLKGKLGARTNYVIEVSYSNVKNQHFFTTESNNLYDDWGIGISKLNNTFSLVYDDMKVLKLSGEVMHSVSDNFSLHLFGNYYSYDLKTQNIAWQIPNFDVTFSSLYKPIESLKFNVDIFVVGERTALISDFSPNYSLAPPTSHEILMDPIIDMNAGADYQLSKSLNVFVKLNNFGFQKYEQWLGYTSKGFNWLAGITYTF